METCKICHQEIENNRHFHREHGITLEDYIKKHEPRYDLNTQQLIPFKGDLDKYRNTDFIHKNNLKAYLKSLPPDQAREYCKNYLAKRKTDKGLDLALGQFEIQGLMFPPITYFDRFEGGYSQLCKELSLKVKFDYNLNLQFNNKVATIYVDSREQNPLLKTNNNKQIVKLNVGDYAPQPNDYQVFVERKSICDLSGSISKGFARFTREVERAQQNGDYLIVLIEEPYKNIQSLPYLPHTKKIRATPEFLLHRIRDLCQTYANIQFCSVDGRKIAMDVMEKIFTLSGDPRKVDWQWAYNTKKLNS